jgi:hypothetical protein
VGLGLLSSFYAMVSLSLQWMCIVTRLISGSDIKSQLKQYGGQGLVSSA